jgi:hypothetical protein
MVKPFSFMAYSIAIFMAITAHPSVEFTIAVFSSRGSLEFTGMDNTMIREHMYIR